MYPLENDVGVYSYSEEQVIRASWLKILDHLEYMCVCMYVYIYIYTRARASMVFQKELYNFESLYIFIQSTCAIF
jgi:hypothetical protein